jgi:gluconate transporter
MGKTLLYGLMLAIPIVIIAGPLFGRVLQRMKVQVNTGLFGGTIEKKGNLPSVASSFIIALLPVMLITLRVLIETFLPNASTNGAVDIIRSVVLFIGDATVALLISVLLAVYYFGLRTGKKMAEVMKWLNDGVSGIALIVFIIATGGVFKQVLIDSGTGREITELSKAWNMPPLVFGWVVAALLRLTLGSATVAGIATAGIVSSLVVGDVSPELMVLSVGAGSIFFSHVNDTGFWMFKEFFNLSLKQTFLSWSLMETIISVLGLVGVLILDQFI